MKKYLRFSICLLVIFLLLCSSCNKRKEDEVSVSSLYVGAKSYVVLDKISGRVLEGNNIHTRILPASTTKILTCLTVLNHFDINSYVVITKDMINIQGSKIYLEVGDIISILDLLYGLMLNSGNDASLTLAISLTGSVNNFVYLMNEECKRIGMKNSTFENPSGLDEDSKNYTTAYDMALLMKDALSNDTFRKIVSTKEYTANLLNGRKLYFSNKHRLIHTNDLTTGGKTGYTKKAGRTLVTSFKKDDFEIIITTFDCSNDWEIHTSLANKIFNSFKQFKLTHSLDILRLTKFKKFNDNLLLFPLENIEQEDEFKITYETYDDKLILYYFKNDELEGYVTI